jgi:negative regulator of flagellin synthesis FlgM
MPPIEVGPARALSAIEARLARTAGGEGTVGPNSAIAAAKQAAQSAPVSTPAPSAPAVQTSRALDAGAPPIDIDRVAEIRKAVENGTYPILPARIADAMIAAGMMLRSAHNG